MLDALNEIKQQTANENPFLGDAAARRLRWELEALAPGDFNRFRLLQDLAKEELRLGETEQAIGHLQQAEQMLQKVGSSKDYYESLMLDMAIAYLRQGENQNCVGCCNGDSCLLPLRGGGVHGRKQGVQRSIECLTPLLQRNPELRTARWLLNIACMAAGTYPHGVPAEHLIPPDRFESPDFPRFKNVAAELGLDTLGLAGGTIVDDFDGDGLLDIVVSSVSTSVSLRFFHHEQDGAFSDQSARAGFAGLYGGLNLVPADYDNDGDLDFVVLRGGWWGKRGQHPKSLLQNDGSARFRDVTFAAGLESARYPSQTAAWADYDNDGDLDLYIGGETNPETGDGPFPNQLFQNQGNGTFKDVARAAGVENLAYCKAVVWGDYDGDRFPDLYVSNLTGENRLYHNDRHGRFTDVAATAGVAGPKRSFPAWFWDFNNDGKLDIYVAAYWPHMRSFVADFAGTPDDPETDCLYQGDGEGRFQNVSHEQRLDRITLPMGCNFGDLDNDGFLDMYLGTGFPLYEALIPNRLFHNNRGQGFEEVTYSAGMGHLQKGHAVAFADLDQDGDQDVFINMGGAFPGDSAHDALFLNPGFDNHWLAVRLVGTTSNRCAIGARLRATILDGGETRHIYRWVNSGGSFGANPLRQHLGVGKATRIEQLQVFWPATGQEQQFRNLAVDQYIDITEGQRDFRRLPYPRLTFKEPAALAREP